MPDVNKTVLVEITTEDAAALRHVIRSAKADAVKKYGAISEWFDEMIEKLNRAEARTLA